MKRPVVVFDFDKTLTHKDTVLGFYRAASKSRMGYLLRLPIYYALAVQKKLGLISNDSLKHCSIKLFLSGNSREELEQVGREYARSIILNKLYQEDFLKQADLDPIVSSASFVEYLQPLFPDRPLFASRIAYNERGFPVGIAQNMYGKEKAKELVQSGISVIDVLYTDSYSDKPLMDMSRKVYLIKNGEKTLIIDRSHEKETLSPVR